MKKLFLFAAVAAMMVGCSETDELALNQVAQQSEKGGIQFDVYTQRAITRAGAAGNAIEGQYGITTESLKNIDPHNVGFGVFAYYTSNSDYDTNSSMPNFMYNQQVKWDKDQYKWTYEPVKYWPNEFGNAAESDDFDKVTFFAYAPWVPFTVNTGIPVADKNATSEEITLQQKKNIVGTVKNNSTGDPYIKYVVDTDPATSVDLLWGVAAEQNGYRGLNYEGEKGDGNVLPGSCYIDLTKQIGTTDSIKWNFKHATAQLNIQIISAVDIETAGDEIYNPEEVEGGAKEYGTNANGKVDDLTKVYLRWIEFNGFVMKGALNLHSELESNEVGVEFAKPNWKGFDGTNDLTYEPVRFYDGLKDGKEGTTNNKQKNETPNGLNPEIIEESIESQMAAAKAAAGTDWDAEAPENQLTWKNKKPGIPTAEYANLFATSGKKDASAPIYVIPADDEDLTIEICYDVQTADSTLAGILSDNKTHGIPVENKIFKNTGVKLEAGKSYTIKIVVGLESVKFTVEVTDWKPKPAAETDVDMPFNPGFAQVRAGEGADQLPFGSVYYIYKDTKNPDDFKVTTLFNKTFVSKYDLTRTLVEVDGEGEYLKYFYFGNKFEYRVLKEGFAGKINQNPEDPEAEVEYVAAKVQKFDPETAKYKDDEDIYFFSEKLVVPAEGAGAPEEAAALEAGKTYHFTPDGGTFERGNVTYTPLEGNYTLSETQDQEYWQISIACSYVERGRRYTQNMTLYIAKNADLDTADGKTARLLMRDSRNNGIISTNVETTISEVAEE